MPPPGLLPSAHQRLIAHVRAVQHRQHWVTGTLYGLAALVVAGAGSGFAARASPLVGRSLWALGLLGASVLVGFFGWHRAQRRVGDAQRTARWVGQRIPELSTDVLA